MGFLVIVDIQAVLPQQADLEGDLPDLIQLFFQRTAAWHPADRRQHPSSAREPSAPLRRSPAARSLSGHAAPQGPAYPALSGSASGPAQDNAQVLEGPAAASAKADARIPRV